MKYPIMHELSRFIAFRNVFLQRWKVEVRQIHLSSKTFIYHMITLTRNRTPAELYFVYSYTFSKNSIAVQDMDIQILVLLDVFNYNLLSNKYQVGNETYLVPRPCCLQNEIHAEFHTTSDKCTMPGNETKCKIHCMAIQEEMTQPTLDLFKTNTQCMKITSTYWSVQLLLITQFPVEL